MQHTLDRLVQASQPSMPSYGSPENAHSATDEESIPADVVSQRSRIAQIERKMIGPSAVAHTDPSRTTKDSGYGSYESCSVVQEDIDQRKEPSDTQSIKTLSSFIDLGLEGRLKGINIFASELIQSLSPDIPEVVEGRDLVVSAIQDALRTYSYSMEQQTWFDGTSDERKAARFIRQQSQ